MVRKPFDEFNKPLFLERLEKLLNDNGVTEEQLGDYIFHSPIQYDRRIKSLTEPVDNEIFDNIAAFFKIHPDYLLGYSDSPQEYFVTPGEIGKNIARSLQELRIGKHKPEDVARNIGIPLNQYWMIERYGDEPTLAIAVKLADYFNVSTDYLLGRSDDPTRH